MAHVWHTLECLANSLVFFLAGSLFGEAMLRIEAPDGLHLSPAGYAAVGEGLAGVVVRRLQLGSSGGDPA